MEKGTWKREHGKGQREKERIHGSIEIALRVRIKTHTQNYRRCLNHVASVQTAVSDVIKLLDADGESQKSNQHWIIPRWNYHGHGLLKTEVSIPEPRRHWAGRVSSSLPWWSAIISGSSLGS